MNDLSSLPLHYPDESGPMRNGAVGKQCRRHVWEWTDWMEDQSRILTRVQWCARCHRRRDAVASRRGRTSLRAGKDAERAIVHRYAGIVCASCGEPFPSRRTGMYGGPDDVLAGGDLFIIQSKAGGWFSERVWAELRKLPRTGGRIPTLIVSDRPESGVHSRRYVVRTLGDDLDLHGSVKP